MRHILWLWVWGAGVAQAETVDLRAFQTQAEARAQAQMASLLKELCPEQCVLLNVRAEVAEEGVFSRDPGFEEVLVEAPAPKVRQVWVRLLVSETLAPAFREKLKTAAEARLMQKVDLSLETVAFPPKMAPAAPPGPVWPSQPPMGWGTPLMPGMAPGPSEGPPGPLTWPWMVFSAVLAGLLLVVLLVLALALRRPMPLPSVNVPSPKEAEPKQTLDSQESARAVRAYLKQLRSQADAVSALVRRALRAREFERVAEWLSAAGEWILKDALADPSLRQAMSGLVQSMMLSAPAKVNSRETVLQQLAAQALAEQVKRAATPYLDHFEFLERGDPSAVASALSKCTVAEVDLALSSVSQTLRQTVFQKLPEPVTQALARYWMGPKESLKPEQIQALVEGLRPGVPAVAEALSVEQLLPLLDALTLEQQTQMLTTLRAQGPVPATVLAEVEMANLDKSTLSSALLKLPLSEVACFLRFSELKVAEAMKAALPARVQEELNEEMRLMSGASPQQREAARSDVLRAIRQQASRAGAAT